MQTHPLKRTTQITQAPVFHCAQKGRYDCGPAALRTVLMWMLMPLESLTRIAELADTGPNGTPILNLQMAATQLGLHAQFTDDWQVAIRHLGFFPAIISVKSSLGGDHFIAVGRLSGGVGNASDPSKPSPEQITEKQIRQRATAFLLVSPAIDPRSPDPIDHGFGPFVWGTLLWQRSYLITQVALSMTVPILAFTWITGLHAIFNAAGQANLLILSTVALAMGAVVVLESFFQQRSRQIKKRFANQVTREISGRMPLPDYPQPKKRLMSLRNFLRRLKQSANKVIRSGESTDLDDTAHSLPNALQTRRKARVVADFCGAMMICVGDCVTVATSLLFVTWLDSALSVLAASLIAYFAVRCPTQNEPIFKWKHASLIVLMAGLIRVFPNPSGTIGLLLIYVLLLRLSGSVNRFTQTKKQCMAALDAYKQVQSSM